MGGFLISGLNQLITNIAFFSCIALLLYAIDITIALMNFFVIRYQSMRQFTVDNVVIPECDSVTVDMVKQSVRRDAFERYLYIKHFIKESSRLWSPFLLLLWTSGVCLLVFCYVLLVSWYQQYGHIDPTLVIYFITATVLNFYILFLISLTNTTVNKIRDAFVYSSLDDYSLLGGRDEWIAYIDQAPIYWTVLGFVITPAWLASFVTAVATALGSVFILPYFTN